ncbi:3-methyladenine DNA glycosylase [Sorangium cellulosum]|uniref:Putative 3-methyladenine DNA glycosylase n=1 Tax=Sorangium cellulosum TaxID=56 RepID=A0A150RGE4_SORCE|nr:3-methyladenine DNA glycosylase [Sorangium cellulosum]KYF99952.1 3-methyladenine DNA glycosylase [Sorangium cellulosum]
MPTTRPTPEPPAPRDRAAALLEGASPLPRDFYARPPLVVARACIGKVLVHRTPEGVAAGRIVETEAYRGPQDLAAHSAGGRRTVRTEVMFGPAGYAYLFMLYGMHWAFNIVVASEGEPHVVLVRAIEPVLGLPLMSRRRGVAPGRVELTNGPGKLCKALGLDRAAYGMDVCGAQLSLLPGAAGRIGRSPRINVDYAGAWAKKPWRFYERGNRYVSVPPRH